MFYNIDTRCNRQSGRPSPLSHKIHLHCISISISIDISGSSRYQLHFYWHWYTEIATGRQSVKIFLKILKNHIYLPLTPPERTAAAALMNRESVMSADLWTSSSPVYKWPHSSPCTRPWWTQDELSMWRGRCQTTCLQSTFFLLAGDFFFTFRWLFFYLQVDFNDGT